MIKVSALGEKGDQQQDDNGQGQSKELHARIQSLKDKTAGASAPKFHIQNSGSLKTLKILSSSEDESTQEPEQERGTDPHVSAYEENLAPILLERESATRVNIIGALLTGAWFGACAYFLFKMHGSSVFALSTQEIGAYLSFALTPVALLWLVLSNLQRRSDVEYYTVLLRSELHNILFPEGESPDKVSKDIERLCRQASDLSVSSKAVMKSIQQARQGMRQEVKEFVSLSKKTEFHIDRLSQDLTEKSGKLLTLSEEIEARFDKIQKAGDKALKNTEKISMRLEKAADNVEGQNDQSLKRLEDVEHSLSRQTDTLSVVSQDIESGAARLSDDLNIQLGHIEDASSRILEDLSESTQKLSDQKYAYESIISGLEDKLDNLDRVEGVTETLKATLSGLETTVSRIESAGDVAVNALGESLTLAVSGSDALRESVTSSAAEFQDSLNEAISKADDLISKAVSKVQVLQEKEGDQKEFLREYLKGFEAQQERLAQAKVGLVSELAQASEKIDEKTLVLDTSLDRLSALSSSAGGLFDQSLNKLEEHLSGFDTRQERLKDVIETRLSSLENVGGKVLEQVEGTARNLRDQVQNVSVLSGKVSAQTHKLQKDIQEQNDNLNASLKATIHNMTDISSVLEKNVQNAEEYASRSENIINNINNNIKVNAEELKTLSDGSINTLRLFGNQINEELARFDDICENLETRAEKTSSSIENALMGIQPNCQEIFLKMEGVEERFKDLKDVVKGVADENIGRLDKLGQEFDLQMISVSKNTAEAVTNIEQASDALSLSAQNIKDAAAGSLKHLSEARKEFKAEIDGFNLIGDEISLKLKDAQKALDSQGAELSEVIGHSVLQIRDAANELGDTARMTADVSEEVVAKITESITHTELQAENFQKAAHASLKQTNDMTADISAKAQGFLSDTKESLKELDKTRHLFATRHKEMEVQLESVLRMSGYYSEEIRKQSKLVAQSAQDSTSSISKAGRDLKKEIGSLNVVADDVTLKIREARKDMGQESRDLIRVSAEVLKQSEQTSKNFSKYSSRLSQLGNDIRQSALDLRNVMSEQEEERFISSARYLLESIYSLTVDLTRSLDGEISEKMWKAFNDGNGDVFMRHLQKVEKALPASKLVEKYKKDGEFRSYAKRYIAQFEKMFMQLPSDQNNALMHAAIRSSDTAKLYQILIKASGQKDITQNS